MERIEIPAEVYFKSKDGKKFRVQEDCERWEAAYSKWTNQAVYREFENEEGQLCYAFWLESEEDLEDVLWFFDTKMHSCTRGSGFVKDLYPQWVVAYPYYDGYNSDYSVSSIEDFKDALYETKQAVEDTLSEVIKLIWEKAR
jgi:predicted transcriptional regulator YdeE